MLLLILLKNTPGEILLQLVLYCPSSYANCFVITSKAALEAIYEAKDYYYIFTTRKSAYIMDKKKFTKGTEKEFNNFIKSKMKKNYKKRCIRKKEEEIG